MATAYNLQDSGDVPALDASYAFRSVLTLAGTSQATATPFFAPITNEEEMSIYYLPSGNTVLTLAIARYDLIVSNNASSTTLEVQGDSSISGYARTSGKDLSFFVQRRGAGILAVNFTNSATLLEDNDIDPATLGIYHTPVQVTSPVANGWIYC